MLLVTAYVRTWNCPDETLECPGQCVILVGTGINNLGLLPEFDNDV